MNFPEFVLTHDVVKSKCPPSAEQVQELGNEMGVKFGREMMEYLTGYGFLLYADVEFYGLTANLLERSDLAKQTAYLHKYFPKTGGYIALENRGDGLYVVVDSDDQVWLYNTESNTLKDSGKSLFQYLIERMKEAGRYCFGPS